MKQHTIALEMAGKRLAGFASTRLPLMYDVALRKIENKIAPDSIKDFDNYPKFRVAEYSVDSGLRPLKGNVLNQTKVVQVIDTETGHYVKLLKNEGEDVKLEIGLIVSTETSSAQGFVQSRSF